MGLRRQVESEPPEAHDINRLDVGLREAGIGELDKLSPASQKDQPAL
jgi:hypothetical protein